MDSEELKQRTKSLAHRCAKLAMALPQNVFTKYIQSQLFRSATSVAANYRAVCLA
jgi:four helix bundle protein